MTSEEYIYATHGLVPPLEIMRPLTDEEREAYNKKLDERSKPTGVNYFDLANGETYIARSKINAMIAEINTLPVYLDCHENFADEYISKTKLNSIIREYRGKENL